MKLTRNQVIQSVTLDFSRKVSSIPREELDEIRWLTYFVPGLFVCMLFCAVFDRDPPGMVGRRAWNGGYGMAPFLEARAGRRTFFRGME